VLVWIIALVGYCNTVHNRPKFAHMALGLPINMESLCKYRDSAAATGHLMAERLNEGHWELHNVRVR
jgi:hypothetical protein